MDKKQLMQICINIAQQNFGRTGKNPSVGALILKDGLIATGVTSCGGTPHAEVNAINNAKNLGINCNDAKMFVTLEPCAHFGKTPPCIDTIIQAGISHIVIGVKDPDSRVNGKGIEKLHNAGIKVEMLEFPEIYELYKAYFVFKTQQRPLVTIKIASSLDGKIALANGKSKWITSENARQYTNFLRSRFNGILVGGNTVKHDKPTLNCRINGLEEFSPKRFVVSKNQFEGYQNVYGTTKEILEDLYKNDIQSLLVEGGANLITQFIKDDLFDELILVQAPVFIGNDGKSCIEELHLKEIPHSNLNVVTQKIVDGNIFTQFIKKVCPQF
jgi:diaminohydroxyphosphoribosylaminopyrimidine deaminase/5-amino-6-(5-phosphoribosylamino)uracil reductase